jgi:hypothetical protein
MKTFTELPDVAEIADILKLKFYRLNKFFYTACAVL